MKKNFLISIASVLLFGIITIQCSKSDSTSTYALSGTVTLSAGGNANGAIVYLSSTPLGTEIVGKTIAAEDGSYMFKTLESGTYYLTAKYNTENKNNLKAGEVEIIFETAGDLEVALDADKTQDIALVSNSSTGTAMIDMTDGWISDVTHSSIGFNFPYDAVNAPFYGHFATFKFTTFKFDQATPANSAFEIEVDFTSVETGAAGGRDGIDGCIANDFGIQFKATADLTAADTTANGKHTASAIIAGTNLAKFKSTSVVTYGDGYLAKGNMNFHGASVAVDFYFKYNEGFEAPNRTGDLVKYSSFVGFTKMNALADFGIVSGHVGDKVVTVTMSAQFNKKVVQ